MPTRAAALIALSALAVLASGFTQPARAQAQGAATVGAVDPRLAEVVAGSWRSAEDRARDAFRRPAEALTFWGLKPGMTILEVQPGGGWWTQILAPYAARTGGRYFATGADLMNPAITTQARQSRKNFEFRFSNRGIYGDVQLVNWGPVATPLTPNTYDFILVSRSMHGWLRMGQPNVDRYMRELARALKPGGSLAIEEHRANPGKQDPKGETGYLTEAWVIEQAQKAGLTLAARSDINANPKDTKDHPFGVWTLPPTLITVPYGSNQPPNKSFDTSKYAAIGESDRMALRFTKAAPTAAPPAPAPAAAAVATAAAPAATTLPAAADPALLGAVGGAWRTAEQRARDASRRPVEALSFWGLRPGMSILEVQPGAQSWWTEILAPYARATGGRFSATGADLANPKTSEAQRKGREAFEQRYASRPEIYGKVEVVNFGMESAPLPANAYDFVLVSRTIHGWLRFGMLDKATRDLFAATKPGGIVAVEAHRANPGPQDPKAMNGYVTEAFVIEAMEKAGFRLAGRSEINANPKDTKDHPFGVWTLPPTRASAPLGSNQPADPNFDRAKYDAIGESDRMTLKFVKPA